MAGSHGGTSSNELAALILSHFNRAAVCTSEFHWMICIILARYPGDEGGNRDAKSLAREVIGDVPRLDGRVRNRHRK